MVALGCCACCVPGVENDGDRACKGGMRQDFSCMWAVVLQEGVMDKMITRCCRFGSKLHHCHRLLRRACPTTATPHTPVSRVSCFVEPSLSM